MMEQIYKYPRTPHIQGSRLQPGDEDLESIPFSNIASKYLVVEEKIDGANTAISFSTDGQMRLQSRGHYLTGGEREKHFNLFKQWAYSHSVTFWDVLGSRYILYGEWLYAKHTVFYDYLPHYFLEYDLLDWEQKQFLSTQRRNELLAGLPLLSVPVLFSGKLNSYKQLTQLLTQSHYIQSGHLERFRQVCEERGLDVERSLSQTDSSSLMEGLYIKVEEEGIVKERYKYVRASFLTTIKQSDGHWLNRPIIPNLLRPDVDLFQ
ncbi:RNA ligase family protein [Limnofasciculus baicalensis]|uniref:RNA ligase family protein n=1 Tax=Limnofasciculus baicalensis BBK-W-15 TaxID=2699891 RepID=A0AAE3KL14_9CYAN|nr:RNA ligase family protein [Limnofasciculus baicalensis]MCP2727171.1 RNA ligase family protein [Limnofasciculus baicalensis BBK-W-15]